MQDLEELLLAEGYPADASYRCECGISGAAFTFKAEAIDENGPVNLKCNSCLLSEERELIVFAEQEAAAALELSDPWNTEQGKYVKLQRNLKVNEALWAVDPASSPLTEACQAEFQTYIQALHRLTVDFAHPNVVIWPTQPELELASLLEV